MPNPVVHFEVMGRDGPALQKFYATLFGWNVDGDNPMNYGMVTADEGGIGGGIGQSPDGNTLVTFYVQVADVQAALSKAEALGGTIVMPAMDMPGGPTLAQFTDPEGNRIGIVAGM